MNHYEVFVGVDVSKKSFTSTLLFADQKLTFTVPSKPEEFEKKLLHHTKGVDREKMLILMEHTGVYHLALAEYLYEKGYQVAVVNPYSMKKFIQAKMSRAKTDKVDSQMIAEYGRSFFDGRLFKPKTEIQKQIETRLGMLEDFQKQLNMLKNQKEALSRVPMKNSEEILSRYEEVIQLIKRQIRELEKEIERLCKENYPEEYELLRSIPGIRNRAISVILSILRGFEGFDSAKKVGSYLGICPSPCESGTSVKGHGEIGKQGRAYGRKVMYMCGLSAKRVNIYCKDFYERLLKRGKSKKVALVAVAYKLLRQAFGVLKNRVPFNPNLA